MEAKTKLRLSKISFSEKFVHFEIASTKTFPSIAYPSTQGSPYSSLTKLMNSFSIISKLTKEFKNFLVF